MVLERYFSTTLLLLIVFVTYINAGKGAKKQKESVSVETNKASCGNLLSAFYVSDNINVMTNAFVVATNISEQGCLELCSSNKDANGAKWTVRGVTNCPPPNVLITNCSTSLINTQSLTLIHSATAKFARESQLVFCASVVYDRDRSKCLMHRKSSEPDGELHRRSEDGKRYFEKFCLAEDVPRDCANKQFVRVDDYILKGYAQATAVFPTMAECVAHCIREKEFECRSAMYFYEEGECITNLESAITRPDDFMKPDDEDKVVFFHNGCIQPGIRTEFAASEDEENKDDSSSGESPENEPETPEATPSELTKITSTPPPQPSTNKIVFKTINEEEMLTESPSTTTTTPAESITTRDTEPTTETVPEPTSSSTPAPIEEPKADMKEEQKKPAKMPKQPIRNIETRLYGAKELETSGDGFFQEKSLLSRRKEMSSPAFTTEPTPSTNRSAVAEEEDKALQPPPPGAPRASMPMTTLKNLPTKQLHLKPIKPEKDHLHSSGPQEDGYFGKWGAWTVCKEAGERRIRRRKCLDLRRCKGALMQVDYCPKDLPQSIQEEPSSPATDAPTGPIRNPLPINLSVTSPSGGSPPSILPPQLPQKELKPLPAGAPGKVDDVWSPWLGNCQHFASNQPCKNNEVIGFESRECIAKDPKMCKGPFFRYCTIPC